MWVLVRRVTASDGLDVAQDRTLGERQSAAGIVDDIDTNSIVGLNSIQKKVVNGERDDNAIRLQRTGSDQFKRVTNSGHVMQEQSDEALVVASSRSSQKSESASLHADLVIESCCSSNNISPLWLKSSMNTSTQRGDSRNRRSKKAKASNVYNQQLVVFSAKEKIFSPQTAARHYRLRNSGGSMSKSPKPGTKLEPQWCPSGLTHTQKRRVQRL
jgi:DNA gyrase/topoisomerase IV subunit A